MYVMKVIWRLVLCALFVIGLTYGFLAHATEPEGHEKALHETHEAREVVEHEKGEAATEALEMEAEAHSEGEEKTHETKGEADH